MKKIANFTKIKPPTFKVNSHTLNEYELRTLMVEVQNGKWKEEEIYVEDIKGNKVMLHKDGTIRDDLYGFNLISTLKYELVKGLNS
jgi:hypothetical protein